MSCSSSPRAFWRPVSLPGPLLGMCCRPAPLTALPTLDAMVPVTTLRPLESSTKGSLLTSRPLIQHSPFSPFSLGRCCIRRLRGFWCEHLLGLLGSESHRMSRFTCHFAGLCGQRDCDQADSLASPGRATLSANQHPQTTHSGTRTLATAYSPLDPDSMAGAWWRRAAHSMVQGKQRAREEEQGESQPSWPWPGPSCPLTRLYLPESYLAVSSSVD